MQGRLRLLQSFVAHRCGIVTETTRSQRVPQTGPEANASVPAMEAAP